MSIKRHLETDPLTGTVETFEYDESEDKAYVHQVTDVSGAIETTKELQNTIDGWNPDKSMRHAAHIPLAICELWKIQYGIDVLNRNHMGAVRKLLDDPEWQFLRVGRFHLGKHD